MKECQLCGCTQNRACVTVEGHGCSWSKSDTSICSVCAGEDVAQRFDRTAEYDEGPSGAVAGFGVVAFVAVLVGLAGGYWWGWSSKMDLVIETARMACE